jgi:hypothetical protein
MFQMNRWCCSIRITARIRVQDSNGIITGVCCRNRGALKFSPSRLLLDYAQPDSLGGVSSALAVNKRKRCC